MADNVDIFVILAGYIMMIITFVSLFVNMRRMGSRYSLGKFDLLWYLSFTNHDDMMIASAVTVNGFFSFMLALLTVHAIGVQPSPVVLA